MATAIFAGVFVLLGLIFGGYVFYKRRSERKRAIRRAFTVVRDLEESAQSDLDNVVQASREAVSKEIAARKKLARYTGDDAYMRMLRKLGKLRNDGKE